MNRLTMNRLIWLLPFAIVGVYACGNDVPAPSDAAAEAATLDAELPDSAADLGYPDWVLQGTCENPELVLPTVDPELSPTDGAAHDWFALFPGYVFSETRMRDLHRCPLRRARSLGMTYVTCFMSSNSFVVTGTLEQATELSRDSRLERVSVSTMGGVSGL